MRIPLLSENHRRLSAADIPIYPMVLMVLTLLTQATLADSTTSLGEIDEGIFHRIPEPGSMFLGIFGFCLILLRRGRL